MTGVAIPADGLPEQHNHIIKDWHSQRGPGPVAHDIGHRKPCVMENRVALPAGPGPRYGTKVAIVKRMARHLPANLVPAALRDHVAAGQRAVVAPGSLPLPKAVWAGVAVGWAVCTSVLLFFLVHLVATGYLLPGHKI
jgi:hypothetical protein